MNLRPLQLGISQFLSQSRSEKRLGLLTHAQVLDESGVPVFERVMERSDLNLHVLFGPQHGFWMDTSQAMMVPTASSRHPSLRIPIYSLYRQDGRHVDPTWLKGLDAVLVDLPDVGVKVYTYIWSVAQLLRACAQAHTRIILLDRPNPIAGLGVLGPVTQEAFTSFVGLHPIGFCHAMTLGEVARYLNEAFRLGCELEVVPMIGWKRHSFWDEYGLTWFNPSPNLRHMEALLHYPATVLIEATAVSEGRGTPEPFTCVGAPYLQSQKLIEQLTTLSIPGITFEPITFVPTEDKFQNQPCEGIRLTCVDRASYDPVFFGLALIWTLRRLYPEFRFRDPPYEYEYTKNPFDITVGNTELRQMISAQAPLQEIKDRLTTQAQAFAKIQKPYLIYSDS